MRLKNSLKLLVGNFKNVYRLLLYKMVIALLATALCYAFVLPEIERLMGSQEMIKLIADTKQFLKAFFSMDADLLAASKEALLGASGSIRQIVKFISGMATEIAWVTLGCVAVFLAKHFLDVLGYFAVGSIVNDKMTTFADTPFFTAYIANLG